MPHLPTPTPAEIAAAGGIDWEPYQPPITSDGTNTPLPPSDAEAAYVARHAAVVAELDRIRERLFDLPAPGGEEDGGDLGRILEQLREVLP